MPSSPPLTGVRVLEFAGLAPAPFCGLLLSSYGASVIRVDRPGSAPTRDALTSYKSSIALDLKNPSSLAILTSLIPKTDIVIDPFRPGVLEKLGLDPSDLLKRNPRLIVVRLTGFRRDGKYKAMAGHDINYLAVSGVLSMLGECGQPPSPPINILGDFAGGGMVAFQGALLALLHRSMSGCGQIVEANMVDGVNFLSTYPRLASKAPLILSGERGKNVLDGGAPYYGCYECKDAGRYMSVGALEPQFFAELLKGLGLSINEIVPGKISRENEEAWPYMREVFTRRFKTKTRKEWEDTFDGTDSCCTPVLEMREMEAAGYDQRPVVGLAESPARPVDMAWNGRTMKPGSGGEEALREWAGWQRGKHFDVQAGTLVLKEQSKL